MKVPDYVYGNIAPCFTVFNEDESFDPNGQRNLYDFMLQSGELSAFFIRAGMGQCHAYEFEDVRQVAKVAAEHLAGKAPVLMNCAGIWDGIREAGHWPNPDTYIEQTVELAKYAESVGATGIVAMVPECIVTESGADINDVYPRFFDTVCDAVSLPVFIYQPPIAPEVRFTPELLARVAEHPSIVGIKVSTTDGYYAYTLIRAVRDIEFHVITGAEMLYYANLYAGSRAVIGGGCNLYPLILNAILHRYEQGDHDGVLEAQDSTDMLFAACPNSAAFMKRWATESGFPVGPTARTTGRGPYGKTRAHLADEDYEAYTKLLESELAKYA